MFISQKSSNFALVIELDRHIEILLLSNDCVIVPGLGGFMAHHAEARYDEEDHTFLPPLRTLGFNPQLTMNDSLLVQSYVEAYDMSYPEALRRIEDEVDELKQHLESEGSYELNDIGTLSVNEDGNYVFSPCEAGILTPELYGLSTFEMAPLGAMAKTLEAPKALNISEAPENSENPEIQEATADTDEEEYEERAIVIKMSWVRNAVAVAAAVLAFFLMTTPVTNSESNLTIGNLNSPVIAGMMPKDSNMEKIDISKIEAQAPKTVVKNDSVAPVKNPAEEAKAVVKADNTTATADQKPYYCIVLASYVSKKNAHAFVEELHQRGYAEAEVFIRNNVTRVIYGNFSTANEAYNKLNSIQKKKGLEEAWVLKIKADKSQKTGV